MIRTRLIEQLADRILAVQRSHPLRVAIDGIDASGKTTLADELVRAVQARGRPVLRASLDGFHRPRADRYRRGAGSAEGYYRDAFDYPALRDNLLFPLGPGGDRRCRLAVFDFRTDRPVSAPTFLAQQDAVLLLDGVFLLRPELDPYWDFRIFLSVDFDTALLRALRRDLALLGSEAAVRERYLQRYQPGQRLYLEEARPLDRADIIVDNNDPGQPEVKRDP
jgi:uridine kinase